MTDRNLPVDRAIDGAAGSGIQSKMETFGNYSLLRYPWGVESRNQTDINIRDINSLRRGRFLTDQLVDFWLKYVQMEKLKPEILETVYVFSSLFYTSLLRTEGTSTPRPNRRRRRIPIDIFLKDYLVFPVVVDSHWLLVIVCNPAKVVSPQDGEPSQKRSKTEEGSNSGSNIADMPMLLILDSYRISQSMGYARSIAATIRSFLTTEWKARRGTDTNFGLENMPLQVPDVPQQSNMSDCGVYLLQFFEAFFSKSPRIVMSNYLNLPHDWIYAYTKNVETDKREDIYQTIRTLLQGKHQLFPNSCKLLPKTTAGLPVSENISQSAFLSLFKNEVQVPAPISESRKTETAQVVRDFFENYRQLTSSKTVQTNANSSDFDGMDLESAKAALGVDDSKPTTQVTVRLADGARYRINLNLQQTVKKIRKFICLLRPDFASRAFCLVKSFPTTQIDEGLTIEEAKLMNSVIIQKMT